MASKTLIGGTTYEISGGKTLIGGTAYKIESGKTLVGGTAYNIDVSSKATVTLKKSAGHSTNANYASVTIDGVIYDGSKPTTLVVPKGTRISCVVSQIAEGTNYTSSIILNGVTVAKTSDDKVTASYSYEISSDVTIGLGYLIATVGQAQTMHGKVVITEE